MTRLASSLLIFVALSGAAHACGAERARIYGMTLQYQSAMAQLTQRRLGMGHGVASDSEEAAMEAVRYRALHLDVQRRRAAILELYVAMVGMECEHFDATSLAQTQDRFRALAAEERAYLDFRMGRKTARLDLGD
ncbi:hypothetical protein ABEG18_16065 [Alsobacter sp. KACC 23698]|uniref:Uncharacterized protein n=1 Tax=Alsobacter sp. KACC 23698 TaxID=3149229 RepID=A0AAU7JAZ4_9HYPH